MVEEIQTHENGANGKRKRAAKSGFGQLWQRWKARNSKQKIEALVKGLVASSVAGGMVLGTIGYVRANDAQNTIKQNEAAWLNDLQEAQEAAQFAVTNAVAAQETADQAQAEAVSAKAVATTAQQAAKEAESKADAAKSVADQAQSTAVSAQAAAEESQRVADAAQSAADQAKSEAVAAQEKAAQALANLETVRDDLSSTQEDVDVAQEVADKAVADAQTAQTAAVGAQTVADKAVEDAEIAQASADAAQDTAVAAGEDAVEAQAAADAAQESANEALEIALQALANAATAQATADEAAAAAAAAQATANEALDRAPHTALLPPQFIPDNIGVFDDGSVGSVNLQPGTYFFTYGGTFPQNFSMRIRTSGGTVIHTVACQAAGTRSNTTIAIANFTQPTTVLLEHDSCGPAASSGTFTNPFIQYIKVA